VVARYSVRVDEQGPECRARPHANGSSANDSLAPQEDLVSHRTRVTEAHVAKLASELTPRELEIVSTLDRVRLASVKHLERLHFTTGRPQANARQARQTLAKLSAKRVVTRLERRIGGVRAGSAGTVYVLDVAGQRLASAAGPAGGIRIRKPWTPGLPFLSHHLAVTELYVLLVEASRSGGCELLAFDAEPLCWRVFTGIGGARQVLKPDAYARLGIGAFEDSYFIEVDRATQSGPAVARKLTMYRRYFENGREQERFGVFPQVLFLVPSEARKRALVEVFDTHPADSWDLFRVAQYDKALDVLAGRVS
jgi:Replication-relaxation